MSDTVEQLKNAFANFLAEDERFTTKGVKASAARARKALGEMTKLAKVRRKEIQDAKLAAAQKTA